MASWTINSAGTTAHPVVPFDAGFLTSAAAEADLGGARLHL
jgi:hypothetical protein